MPISITYRVPMYYSFPSRYHNGYRLEMEHFLDVVQGKEKCSVTDRMTMAVSKIATACHQAAKSGLPVKLEWGKEEIPEDYVQGKE